VNQFKQLVIDILRQRPTPETQDGGRQTGNSIFSAAGSCSDIVPNAEIGFSDPVSSTEMTITLSDTFDSLF
jgi:hypothetical protein